MDLLDTDHVRCGSRDQWATTVRTGEGPEEEGESGDGGGCGSEKEWLAIMLGWDVEEWYGNQEKEDEAEEIG